MPRLKVLVLADRSKNRAAMRNALIWITRCPRGTDLIALAIHVIDPVASSQASLAKPGEKLQMTPSSCHAAHAALLCADRFNAILHVTCGWKSSDTEDVVTGRIFISYRRGDDQSAAGKLYDRLLQHFDREQLFMDVNTIEPGVDFVKVLDEQVAQCLAFIAVIGPRWLTARGNDGNPRLDNPTDYIRVEIESALKRDIRVIPVLVDGASMPQSSDLPSSLQALARRNAVEIAHHRFVADCDDLARSIKRALGVAITPSAPAQHFVSSSAPQASAKLSWPQILFSFKGRLARMPFLIGLIFLVAFVVALQGSIMFTLNSIFRGAEAQSGEVTRRLAFFEDRLWAIMDISVWWPSWALILKRLHDLGYGWKALLFFVALDVLSVVINLLGYQEIDTQLTLFTLGVALMLGAIKGTTGSNRYGPDPLGCEAV
jgi:uncharacterized membrane protein YhaH (DUF805 family)